MSLHRGLISLCCQVTSRLEGAPHGVIIVENRKKKVLNSWLKLFHLLYAKKVVGII